MSKLGLAKVACMVVVLCAAVALDSPAQTVFTTLVNFDGNDGSYPNYAPLVQGFDGKLYGTTTAGGNVSGCSYITYGCGTVFKMSPSGALTPLYAFSGADGVGPQAGLVLSTDGNFYGATYTSYTPNNSNNPGTAFKISPAGALTTLYTFCSQNGCVDGRFPSGLVRGTDGNFYGTTFDGGSGDCFGLGCGTVFKITASGVLTVLHSFLDSPDGSHPIAGLIQGANGNFYGATQQGGAYHGGTVFKITSTGKLTILYSFCAQFNCPDGNQPYGTLVEGNDGNFYGTTLFGGASVGTVFKITPNGTLTSLHTFNGLDGAYPSSALVQATDGNFYGTTSANGANSLGGTIFSITASGTLTTLYNFCSQADCTDGNGPTGGLVQHTNGKFYGTTFTGGQTSGNCTFQPGCGTIFSLSVGLGPFVQTLPASGKVGKTVYILGTNLSGTTKVSFNGTAAVFTVVSGTEIKTSVPSGATTGYVKVTTPNGTLKSSRKFRVTPQITSFSPTSGPVGTPVTITGVSLTQTTKVTFGGVKATNFTVDSDNQVTATVPAGAKTGKIVITTPGGTDSSATDFTVTP